MRTRTVAQVAAQVCSLWLAFGNFASDTVWPTPARRAVPRASASGPLGMQQNRHFLHPCRGAVCTDNPNPPAALRLPGATILRPFGPDPQSALAQLVIAASQAGRHELKHSINLEDWPTACAWSGEGRLLVGLGNGYLSIVEIHAGRPLVRRKLWLRSQAFQILVHPDGKKAYASLWGSSEVAVLDLRGFSLRKRISVGLGPAYMDLSPDGAKLYVANQKSFSFSVIDTASDRSLRNVRLKETPSALAVGRNQRDIYVTLSSGDLAGLAGRDFRVIGSVSIGAVAGSPLLASPDGRVLWTLGDNDELLEIDLDTSRIARTVQVGRGATYLTLSPARDLIYVSNSAAGSISIVEIENFEEIRQLRVGSRPAASCVSPDGRYLAVCDRQTRRIHVIERD